MVKFGRVYMESVTLQGSVVVLSEKEYQNFIDRISRLEKMVDYLVTVIEDREDIQYMREAEADYRAGDSIPFADLLAEVKAEIAD
jgi:hypothetical protein